MEVVPLGSAPEIAVAAAGIIEAAVRAKPAAVLGLATGSTRSARAGSAAAWS